jgi:hypothetical protein
MTGLRDTLNRLNPYDRSKVPDILKDETEASNRTGQVYGYGISAKRYTLFTYVDGRPVVPERIDGKRAYSEHGLGLYLSPSVDRGWMRETWQYLLDQAHGMNPRLPDWAVRPALIQTSISSPHVMRMLKKYNDRKSYRELVKPFGFVLLITTSGLDVVRQQWKPSGRLITPYSKDPEQWLSQKWYDIEKPESRPARLDEKLVKIMHHVLREYRFAPESKSQGEPTGVMSRRTVQVLSVIHTGKETNKIEDAGIQPLIISYRQVVTDYADNEKSVNQDGRPVNLPAIRLALNDMSAREIARQATQLSLDETTNLIEYKRGNKRVQKWHEVWDEKSGKEIAKAMVTIPVKYETVSRFLAGEKIRPQTVRLIELVAANRIRTLSRANDRDTAELVLQKWYSRKFRMIPVKG